MNSIENKEKTVTRIKHKIEKYSKRIEDYENRKENLSIHGHWSLGYFEGRKSILEEILDELNESPESVLHQLKSNQEKVKDSNDEKNNKVKQKEVER